MQPYQALLPLLAAGLAIVQVANAFDITVDEVTCARMLLTVGLTSEEYDTASLVSIDIGGERVSEFDLDGSYSPTILTADFNAVFFSGSEPTSGTSTVEFQLLDASESPIPGSPPLSQDITFECGTVLRPSDSATASSTVPSTTSRTSASSTGSSSRPTSASGSGDNASSSDSGSGSSNTGAIVGGVVGGIAALAVLGILAFCLMRRRRREQRRLGLVGQRDVDESGSRGPNDSTASLATGPEPENAQTPMMRDVSTKNVFADPPSAAATNASSREARTAAVAGAGAAAAGGLGAAAIAARRSRSKSPARSEQRRPSMTSKATADSIDDRPSPPTLAKTSAPAPPIPDVLATEQASTTHTAPTSPETATADLAPTADSNSSPSTSSADAVARPNQPSASTAAAGVGAAAAAATATAATTEATSPKSKNSRWGFKRASQDAKAKSPPMTPSDLRSLASSVPSQKSADGAESPVRSFKVIQKPQSPQMNGGELPASGSRSGYATPSSASVRNAQYSRAPSVVSLSAGFSEVPAMPPSAPSTVSPVGEFGAVGGGNMAGVGAGRGFLAGGMSTSSANSTKWHQQHYSVMPNFSQRALARSSQLEEDLIFGNLGMGLAPAPGLAGNGSEGGSARSAKSQGSKRDPFGDK